MSVPICAPAAVLDSVRPTLKSKLRREAANATPVLHRDEVPAVLESVGIAAPKSWPSCRWRNSCAVYFAGSDAGPIKIGWSDNPSSRLWHLGHRPLQLRPLLALVRCGSGHERVLHLLFEQERIVGEFFAGQRLDDFVAAARAASNRTLGRF